MKILIVKLSSIGDVVHALPCLTAIRENLPDAEISWVVERKCAEVLRDNPFLHRLIEIDTKAIRQQAKIGDSLRLAQEHWSELRAAGFDIALDLQGLWKSAFIAKFSGAKRRVGFAKNALREPSSRLLLTEKIEVPVQENIILKNLALVSKALNFNLPTIKNFEFPIFPNETHEREADEIIEKTGENLAILNVGGGWKTKLWSAEKFGQLADKLFETHGLKSVISFGPNEESLAKQAITASKSGQVFAANPSLRGFFALAKRAKIYVGGDTGLTHLAVAAKCPIVGIFGPTEWWRNGSPFPDDICVERNDIGCRENCHRRTCGNWICLDISVETVFRAVQKRLAGFPK